MSLYNVLVDEIILYSSKVYANKFLLISMWRIGIGHDLPIYNSDLYTFNKADRLSNRPEKSTSRLWTKDWRLINQLAKRHNADKDTINVIVTLRCCCVIGEVALLDEPNVALIKC